jgi:hypothetical protein
MQIMEDAHIDRKTYLMVCLLSLHCGCLVCGVYGWDLVTENERMHVLPCLSSKHDISWSSQISL